MCIEVFFKVGCGSIVVFHFEWLVFVMADYLCEGYKPGEAVALPSVEALSKEAIAIFMQSSKSKLPVSLMSATWFGIQHLPSTSFESRISQLLLGLF